MIIFININCRIFIKFTRYVLVHYDNDKVIDLLPEKPEEFMNALVRRLEHKEEGEDTF